MFRGLVWTLRQRRYAALAVVGLIVALGCIGAGSFEMHRYAEKRHDNDVLRANWRAAAQPLSTELVPLTGHSRAPDSLAIRYRTVTASGNYLADHQEYVADQTQGGRQGFAVLTPLRTADGVLLVVRGFVPATATNTRPATVPAPPTGTIRVTGWLETPQSARDRLGALGHDEVASINTVEQAARLHAGVYQGYLTLGAHQAGTAGLGVFPKPDMSNPSGGAAEWQLLSYVVQWYAFAVLALLMPFLVSRSEVRDAQRRFLGIEPDAAELDGQLAPNAVGAGEVGGELAVRPGGTVARLGPAVAQRLARGERLADRYGRSLGAAPEQALAQAAAAAGAPRPAVRDSSATPHRSEDGYHGSYNDYLWELALADGNLPEVFPKPGTEDAERTDR